jgi:transcriptional regulator with XRE-family HTH domain
MLYSFLMEINELFSVNLVRLRKKKGLSQRGLAEKTRLTQRMINLYEHNPHSLPVDRFKLLANALDARVSDFFDESDVSPIDTLDVRWLKKIQEIQSLSESDRKEINQHINSLLEKTRLKRSTTEPVG